MRRTPPFYVRQRVSFGAARQTKTSCHAVEIPGPERGLASVQNGPCLVESRRGHAAVGSAAMPHRCTKQRERRQGYPRNKAP